MTDHPPNRLWPLALLGWLAAFPPQGREATAREPDAPRLEQPRPVPNPATPTPAALPAAEAPRRRRRRKPAA